MGAGDGGEAFSTCCGLLLLRKGESGLGGSPKWRGTHGWAQNGATTDRGSLCVLLLGRNKLSVKDRKTI